MAYIVQSVMSYTDTVLTASFTPDQWITESQVDDDYLVLVAFNDGGGTAMGSASGWTEHYKSAASISGTRMGIWSKKRSGSDITAPTITGANDDWVACVMLIRDVDASTFLDVAIGTTEQTANTTKPAAPSVTTTTADALVLRILGGDTGAWANPTGTIGGSIDVARRQEAGAIELYIAQQCKRTAGATGTFTWDRGAADGGIQVTMAIRNKSGGAAAVDASVAFTPIEEFTNASDIPTAVSIHTRQATIAGVTTLTPTAGPAATTNNAYSADAAWYSPFVTVSWTPPATIGVFGGVFPVTANWSAGNLFACVAHVPLAGSTSSAGPIFYFEDNVGVWRTWRPINKALFGNSVFKTITADLPNETFIDSSGSIDWSNIVYFGLLLHHITATATARSVGLRALGSISTALALTGGGANSPADFADLALAVGGGGGMGRASLQGSGQALVGVPVQIGNGTDSTYFKGSAQSLEYQIGGHATTPGFRLGTGDQSFTIYASASDTIDLSSAIVATTNAQPFTIHASSSTSATYNFTGTSIVGWDVTWKTGVTCSGAAFQECGEIDAKGAQFNNCVISATRSTDAAISFSANSSMTGTTIDLTGTSAAYHLELTSAVTAFTLTNVTFTGTPGTDKVHVKATTGTVTITLDGTTLVAGDITSDGATVTLVAPSDDLTVTSTAANTLLQVFTTGTQTVLASTTGTSLVYTHTSQTVDIVAQKAGYLPQRITGVALSGDVTQAFTMVPDYNYDAAHGLTYTTSASWASNQLTVPTWGPSVRGVYSLMIDSFISETALRNTAFNLSMNGPTTLFLTNGAEGASDASITNLTGGGVRYLSGAGATTAEFVGVLSQGVVSGSQAEYELGAGGSVVDTRATGDVNQIIKTYGDASHGNFDKRGHLQFKVQRNGYRQAEADVLTTYGIATMEPTLYIVSLTMAAIDGLTLGDPAPSGLSITDDSGAPILWDAGDGSKYYSLTILDAGTNSGNTILRWANYNLSLDTTFQGKEPFFWPELLIDNGAAYETLRGILHANPDVAVGVRVIRTGGTPHPDFTRFQADDGTYGTPPVLASISISSIPNAGAVPTRLQIINATAAAASVWQATTAYADNDVRLRSTGVGTESTAGRYFRVTTAGTSAGTEPTWNTTPGATTTDGTVTWTCYSVLFYDADPAATSYSTTYTDGNEFLAGETVTIRFAEMNGGTSFKKFSANVVAASTGFSVQVDEEADEVYATNALDGSAYESTYSPNYTYDRLVLDTNTDYAGTAAYAYFCYLLTSTNGMYEFWGGLTAIDTGNYRIESDVLDMYFDETGGFVKQTDNVRIFRKDGARPALDPTTGGNGIEINWRVPVSVVSSGGSALTPSESAHLLALPSAEATATATLSAATTTPIHADIRKVNNITIDGAGTTGDPWGPA